MKYKPGERYNKAIKKKSDPMKHKYTTADVMKMAGKNQGASILSSLAKYANLTGPGSVSSNFSNNFRRNTAKPAYADTASAINETFDKAEQNLASGSMPYEQWKAKEIADIYAKFPNMSQEQRDLVKMGATPYQLMSYPGHYVLVLPWAGNLPLNIKGPSGNLRDVVGGLGEYAGKDIYHKSRRMKKKTKKMKKKLFGFGKKAATSTPSAPKQFRNNLRATKQLIDSL